MPKVIKELLESGKELWESLGGPAGGLDVSRRPEWPVSVSCTSQ